MQLAPILYGLSLCDVPHASLHDFAAFTATRIVATYNTRLKSSMWIATQSQVGHSCSDTHVQLGMSSTANQMAMAGGQEDRALESSLLAQVRLLLMTAISCSYVVMSCCEQREHAGMEVGRHFAGRQCKQGQCKSDVVCSPASAAQGWHQGWGSRHPCPRGCGPAGVPAAGAAPAQFSMEDGYLLGRKLQPQQHELTNTG